MAHWRGRKGSHTGGWRGVKKRDGAGGDGGQDGGQVGHGLVSMEPRLPVRHAEL